MKDDVVDRAVRFRLELRVLPQIARQLRLGAPGSGDAGDQQGEQHHRPEHDQQGKPLFAALRPWRSRRSRHCVRWFGSRSGHPHQCARPARIENASNPFSACVTDAMKAGSLRVGLAASAAISLAAAFDSPVISNLPSRMLKSVRNVSSGKRGGDGGQHGQRIAHPAVLGGDQGGRRRVPGDSRPQCLGQSHVRLQRIDPVLDAHLRHGLQDEGQHDGSDHQDGCSGETEPQIAPAALLGRRHVPQRDDAGRPRRRRRLQPGRSGAKSLEHRTQRWQRDFRHEGDTNMQASPFPIAPYDRPGPEQFLDGERGDAVHLIAQHARQVGFRGERQCDRSFQQHIARNAHRDRMPAVVFPQDRSRLVHPGRIQHESTEIRHLARAPCAQAGSPAAPLPDVPPPK